MKYCFIVGLLFLSTLTMVLWEQDVAADDAVVSPSVKIQKTFDQGTLIEHTLALVHPPHTVSLHVSQRRAAEGSETIAHTSLAFRHEASEDAALMTRVEFETVFAELLTAFQDAFAAGQVPDSLGSGGFLGVGEMEKNSVLAFRDFASWEAYLDNPAAFTQWQIHEVVLEHWKAAKVFEPVIVALARAGYAAELSGFEKLFVFKASELKTGPELQALGITGSQKVPYPGMIAFTIKARR